MSKPRTAPRFAVGQRVRINNTISTRYTRHEGTVVSVKQNHHAKATNTTLDKYSVSFSDNEQAEFFEIQLERVT